MDLVVWVALGIAFLTIGVAIARALRLLELVVERGRVVSARGRAPAELLREMVDVLERARATGRVTLAIEGGEVAVRALGMDEATTQRLRNVVGRFPAARLKSAPRVRS
jgi:hypothetical protein